MCIVFFVVCPIDMCKNILNPLIVHLLILDIGPDIEAYLNNQIDTQDNLTICPNLNILPIDPTKNKPTVSVYVCHLCQMYPLFVPTSCNPQVKDAVYRSKPLNTHI